MPLAHRFGSIIAWQVHEHDVAGDALDECPDSGIVVLSDNERHLSRCQDADLDQVMRQDPVADPDLGTNGAVDADAVPAVSTTQRH